MFPPHVARLDDAFDYLVLWCDIIGGEPLDGIDWEESEDASGRLAVRVRPFRVRFGVGTILRASFATTIGAGSAPASGRYSFDLRLVARSEKTPNIEAELEGKL